LSIEGQAGGKWHVIKVMLLGVTLPVWGKSMKVS